MSNQTTGSGGPPPLPTQPLPYASPHPPGVPHPQSSNDAQRVFDTVAGPNVRLVDNLVQLACVVIGGIAGYVIGTIRSDDPSTAFIGAAIGVIGSLALSGLVIGIVRGLGARRRR